MRLTAAQIDYVRRHQHMGAAQIARELGVTYHAIRRRLDPDFRRKRNTASLAWYHAHARPRRAPAKRPIALQELRLPA